MMYESYQKMYKELEERYETLKNQIEEQEESDTIIDLRQDLANALNMLKRNVDFKNINYN